MTQFLIIASLAVASCGGLLAETTTGDAARGEQLLRDRGCIVCHKMNGEGGNGAPDLGARRSRNYTPAGLAGVMWSHAPSAWAQTAARSKGTIEISPAQAADLFAFFSSRRYFEPRGDAKRGKQVFAGKKCASCHGIREQIPGAAMPSRWWPGIRRATRSGLPTTCGIFRWRWTGRSSARACVIRGSVPGRSTIFFFIWTISPRSAPRSPSFNSRASTRAAASIIPCSATPAMQGKLALEKRTARLSMADIQAAIWNHASTRLRAAAGGELRGNVRSGRVFVVAGASR